MLPKAKIHNYGTQQSEADHASDHLLGSGYPSVEAYAKHAKKGSLSGMSQSDAFQRYLAGISKYPLLTRDQERALVERVKTLNDKQAAQELVTANLRLVVKIAMDYSNIWMQNLLDLIQEGNLGLIKAVDKYNPEKNVKFSYYASFWIKAYIIKHLMDNWRLVKIGTTQVQRKLFFNLKSEKRKLKEDGFEPSAELLSQRLGVPKKDVVEMDQRISGWDVSLDAPLTEDSDTARVDLLTVPFESLDEKVTQKQLNSILRQHIERVREDMDSRERHIFSQRIIAEDPATLSEIGEKFGISRERVRQIQKGIIAKFRDSFQQELPDYAAHRDRSLVDYDVTH